MPDRVVLFVDYENVYWGARRAWHRWGAPLAFGEVWPDELGRLICEKAGPFGERVLAEVRVYRGMPSVANDVELNAAVRQQHEMWKRRSEVPVEVFEHTLKRRRVKCPVCGAVRERLEEKGVDVNLAIDLISGAHQRSYDVGVVCSTDTDFVPAIRLARDLGARVENALWWTGRRHRDRPLLPNEIWHHRLSRADYRLVRDHTFP